MYQHTDNYIKCLSGEINSANIELLKAADLQNTNPDILVLIVAGNDNSWERSCNSCHGRARMQGYLKFIQNQSESSVNEFGTTYRMKAIGLKRYFWGLWFWAKKGSFNFQGNSVGNSVTCKIVSSQGQYSVGYSFGLNKNSAGNARFFEIDLRPETIADQSDLPRITSAAFDLTYAFNNSTSNNTG